MNKKKLALFYISIVSLQYAHVTFAQKDSGGKPKSGGKNEPGTNDKGGHLDKHAVDDKDPNHHSNKKFIYRCAYGSTMTGLTPNFAKGKTTDDSMDLFVKHVRCSRVNKKVRDIPVKCDWFPTICPENTVYIRSIRKQVDEGTPHFEFGCCINKLACNGQCVQLKLTLTSDQQMFFFPEKQDESDELAPAITNIMIHDIDGVATIEWKFCLTTSLCYTPPPGTPPNPNAPQPGNLLGLLGLLGLLALLALGKPSSSSSAPAPASTASG